MAIFPLCKCLGMNFFCGATLFAKLARFWYLAPCANIYLIIDIFYIKIQQILLIWFSEPDTEPKIAAKPGSAEPVSRYVLTLRIAES